MKEELEELVEEFSRLLSPFEYKQYIFKIRDYLIPYLVINKQGIDVSRVFKEEFTRMDIINSVIFYVKENQNVESLSAIDDFLIATNRFFEELLFNKYPNPTLMKCKPFTQLGLEIQKRLLDENIELKPRETYPAINTEQYSFILNHLKNTGLSNAKIKKFKVSSIIIKMMLLFGFSYDIIIGFKVENYSIEKRNLKVDYNRNGKQHIFVEMPYFLAKELETYLQERETKASDYLFVTRDNTQIGNSFIKDTLDDIRKQYDLKKKTVLDLGKNQFTPTGLQKYAIIQMILVGMNQSIIMDFTGQKDDIYNDCQNEVNLQKEINRNRYVNQMLRGISTYDEM